MALSKPSTASHLLLWGLVCAAATGGCLAKNLTGNPIEESKIRNGFTDDYRAYLVQVHYITSQSIFGDVKESCAGSVIGTRHALTAAHCICNAKTLQLVEPKLVSTVRRRTNTPDRFLIPAAQLFRHPKYSLQKVGIDRYGVYDVGVIRVNQDLNGIHLKLPAIGRGPAFGKQLLAGAWGYVEPTGPAATQIKYGYFTVLTRAECETDERGLCAWNDLLHVEWQDYACTLQCVYHGDSGAALFDIDIHTVYGVHTASSCGRNREFAFNTDLSNREVNDWVAPFAKN